MTKGLHKNSLRKVDNPHQWMIDDARMELIQQIKAEVLRLKEEHQVPTFRGDMYEEGGVNGYQLALDKLLSRLSDLEKECEKPNSQWSEEDENRLNAVIELLENTSAIHPNYSHRKLIIWLKSFHLKVKSEKPMNPVLQDFPTTEKEMQDFLATHERIPVPERLNSLERILQEQPVCEGLEEEMDRYLGIGRNKKGEAFDLEDGSPCSDWKDDATSECDIRLARHFYELGRQSKQTEWTEKDEKMFRDAWWHISYSVSNGTSTDDVTVSLVGSKIYEIAFSRASRRSTRGWRRRFPTILTSISTSETMKH